MQRNKGFIGLIAILITVAIISIAVWRTNLLTNIFNLQDGSSDGRNMIEQAHDAKQSAVDLKAKLELQDRQRMGI